MDQSDLSVKAVSPGAQGTGGARRAQGEGYYLQADREAIEACMKIMGRVLFRDRQLYLCYSGSFLEFDYTGSRLGARLASCEGPGEERAWMGVYADGRLQSRFPLLPGLHNYCLYEKEREKEEGKPVRLRLMKLTEAQYATCSVLGFYMEPGATAAPAPYKERRIEFIGDSITCGYGIEGRDGDAFTTSEENAAGAYSVLCAQELEADYQLVSWSGIGITSCYVDAASEEPAADVLMPAIYPYTDAYLFHRNGWGEPERWDFGRFRADTVVINLGTNDASYVRDREERKENFVREYIRFLKMVRLYRENARIICILGVMDQSLCPQVEQAVRMYREETGDERVFYMEQEPQRAEDGIGTAGHPAPAAHRRMAEELGGYLCNR